MHCDQSPCLRGSAAAAGLSRASASGTPDSAAAYQQQQGHAPAAAWAAVQPPPARSAAPADVHSLHALQQAWLQPLLSVLPCTAAAGMLTGVDDQQPLVEAGAAEHQLLSRPAPARACTARSGSEQQCWSIEVQHAAGQQPRAGVRERLCHCCPALWWRRLPACCLLCSMAIRWVAVGISYAL